MGANNSKSDGQLVEYQSQEPEDLAWAGATNSNSSDDWLEDYFRQVLGWAMYNILYGHLKRVTPKAGINVYFDLPTDEDGTEDYFFYELRTSWKRVFVVLVLCGVGAATLAYKTYALFFARNKVNGYWWELVEPEEGVPERYSGISLVHVRLSNVASRHTISGTKYDPKGNFQREWVCPEIGVDKDRKIDQKNSSTHVIFKWRNIFEGGVPKEGCGEIEFFSFRNGKTNVGGEGRFTLAGNDMAASPRAFKMTMARPGRVELVFLWIATKIRYEVITKAIVCNAYERMKMGLSPSIRSPGQLTDADVKRIVSSMPSRRVWNNKKGYKKVAVADDGTKIAIGDVKKSWWKGNMYQIVNDSGSDLIVKRIVCKKGMLLQDLKVKVAGEGSVGGGGGEVSFDRAWKLLNDEIDPKYETLTETLPPFEEGKRTGVRRFPDGSVSMWVDIADSSDSYHSQVELQKGCVVTVY